MTATESRTESPAELVERIRSGADPEAEARLVERYARGVRLILDRHTRRPGEAEDLFQDTFLRAVAKLRGGELRDPSKLGPFLGSLARNLAIEYYRKVERRQTEADSETAESLPTVDDVQLGDLLRGEEANLVRRTLDDLSTDRDREVLFRFYIAEEDKDTIAADHGLTALQFNRVLHRARQRYKGHYLDRLEQVQGTRALAFGIVWILLLGVAGPVLQQLGHRMARGD